MHATPSNKFVPAGFRGFLRAFRSRPAVAIWVAVGVLRSDLALAGTVPAVSFGALDEVVSVEIRANGVGEAVRQLVEQGGKTSEAIKHMSIQVDDGFKERPIRLRYSNVSFFFVLHEIMQFANAGLDVDAGGNGFVVRRVEETDGMCKTRDYFMPEYVFRRLGLPLDSPEAAAARIRDLRIPLIVLEVDASTGRIRLSGGDLTLRAFEMLANSVSRTGIDISQLKGSPPTPLNPPADKMPDKEKAPPVEATNSQPKGASGEAR